MASYPDVPRTSLKDQATHIAVDKLNTAVKAIFKALREITSPLVWTPATMENSFTAFGSGWAEAAYTIDPFGRVQLRGLVARSAAALNTTIFTLPLALRPAYAKLFVVSGNSNFARVDIDQGGRVRVLSAVSATWYTNISLDGISFYART